MDSSSLTPLALILATATIISAIAAGISAVAAVQSSRAANRLLDETRAMRRAQTDPAVVVSVEPREEWINWLDMVVQNRGQGIARDVQLSVHPDFEFADGLFLSQIGIFKHGINILGPHQTIRFFFTSMVDKPEGKFDKQFQILTKYRDDGGKSYRHSFDIRLKELEGMSQLGNPPLHSLARDIGKIQRDINTWTTGFNRLHIQLHLRSKFRIPLKYRARSYVRSVLSMISSLRRLIRR